MHAAIISWNTLLIATIEISSYSRVQNQETALQHHKLHWRMSEALSLTLLQSAVKMTRLLRTINIDAG